MSIAKVTCYLLAIFSFSSSQLPGIKQRDRIFFRPLAKMAVHQQPCHYSNRELLRFSVSSDISGLPLKIIFLQKHEYMDNLHKTKVKLMDIDWPCTVFMQTNSGVGILQTKGLSDHWTAGTNFSLTDFTIWMALSDNIIQRLVSCAEVKN